MKNKFNKTLDSAQAHLRGYAKVMEFTTGFKPLAVLKCIKELEEMKKELEK